MTVLDRSEAQALAAQLRQEIATVIVGQEDVVEDILTALAAGGHALLEGVPGLAKTLLISTLAKISGLSFNRIQFTPDLMPADITGTEVIREDKTTGSRELVFYQDRFSHPLCSPMKSTGRRRKPRLLCWKRCKKNKSQPAAKYDRCRNHSSCWRRKPHRTRGHLPLTGSTAGPFLLKIAVGYPTAEEELAIVTATTGSKQNEAQAITNAEQLLALQNLVRETPIAEAVARYAIAVVRATRSLEDGGHADIAPLLRWGAGPRAAQAMVLAAKARATLAGRSYVGIDDISAVAPSVLRHRLLPSYAAEAEGVTGDVLIRRLLEIVDLPRTAAENEPALAAHLDN